jgi:hypothetical protein
VVGLGIYSKIELQANSRIGLAAGRQGPAKLVGLPGPWPDIMTAKGSRSQMSVRLWGALIE